MEATEWLPLDVIPAQEINLAVPGYPFGANLKENGYHRAGCGLITGTEGQPCPCLALERFRSPMGVGTECYGSGYGQYFVSTNRPWPALDRVP